MKFEEIPGHNTIKDTLCTMVSNKRIPHALLFCGEEGCGHLAIALAFIQFIFCEEKINSDSCGKCRQCIRLQKLEHPDLHLVFPIAISNQLKNSDSVVSEFRKTLLGQPFIRLEDWFSELGAENKQPVIPVEESDQIIRKLSYTSYEGGYKVMLVWMPEKMNLASANKLLKILEEPPDDTLFFLVASYLDQLLTTIISRSQLVKFTPVKEEEIKDALIKKFKVSAEKATQAASLSRGNFREALAILSGEETEINYLELFQQFMRYALKFDVFKGNEWIENVASLGRENQKHFIQYALHLIRECLINNFGDVALINVSGKELEFIKKFSPFIHQKNYEKIVEELNAAFFHIERNAHSKMLFMDLSLKMNELLNVKNTSPAN